MLSVCLYHTLTRTNPLSITTITESHEWRVPDGFYDVPIGGLTVSPSLFTAGWTEGPWVNYNDTSSTPYPSGWLTVMMSKDVNGSHWQEFRGLETFPNSEILRTGNKFEIKVYRSNGIGAHCGFPDSESDDSYFGTRHAYPFAGRNPNFDPFLITTNYSAGPGFYLFDVRHWWQGTCVYMWLSLSLSLSLSFSLSCTPTLTLHSLTHSLTHLCN